MRKKRARAAVRKPREPKPAKVLHVVHWAEFDPETGDCETGTFSKPYSTHEKARQAIGEVVFRGIRDAVYRMTGISPDDAEVFEISKECVKTLPDGGVRVEGQGNGKRAIYRIAGFTDTNVV